MSLYEPHMRARKASPTPEGILTRQIRDVLNHVQIYHWKTWQGPMSHKGVADILGILPDGRLLAIEIKSARGVLSLRQQLFLDEINRNGGVAICARSVDDVIVGLGLTARFIEYRNKGVDKGGKV